MENGRESAAATRYVMPKAMSAMSAVAAQQTQTKGASTPQVHADRTTPVASSTTIPLAGMGAIRRSFVAAQNTPMGALLSASLPPPPAPLVANQQCFHSCAITSA